MLLSQKWRRYLSGKTVRRNTAARSTQHLSEVLEPRVFLSITTVNDTVSTTAFSPVTITQAQLLSNDSGATSIEGISPAAHGTIVNNGDGTFTYTPNPGFAGQDQFTYAATDARAVLTIPPGHGISGFGQVLVSSFDFGVSRSSIGSSPTFSTIHLTADSNLASPGFLAAVNVNNGIPVVSLTAYDSQCRPSLNLTFGTVFVTAVQTGTSDDGSVDNIDLAVGSVAVTYYSYNTNGTVTLFHTAYNRLNNSLTTVSPVPGSDLAHLASPPPEILSFGPSEDIGINSSDFNYSQDITAEGISSGPLKFNPLSFTTSPNIESLPMLSRVFTGNVIPTMAYTANNAGAGVAAQYAMGNVFVSNYSITIDGDGSATETYQLQPQSITQTYTPSTGTARSATWSVQTNSGTAQANLGTSSVPDPTAPGDILDFVFPTVSGNTGGKVKLLSYSFGLENPNVASGGTAGFDNFEFQMDYNSAAPGLLATAGNGFLLDYLTLTSRNAARNVVATWVMNQAVVTSVDYNSEGDGHIIQDVHVAFLSLNTSVVSATHGPNLGMWDQLHNTGTGGFIPGDFTAAQQAARRAKAVRSHASAAPAADAVLDFGPVSGGEATLAVTSANWTASHPETFNPSTGLFTQGPLDLNQFTFTAALDAQAAGLIFGVGRGTLFRRVLYTTYDSAGNITAQYALGNAELNKFQLAGDQDGPPATETFGLVFLSVAQVVNPTTTPGQTTYGFGWNRLTDSPLNVTDPQFGVTASTGTLDQTPEFHGNVVPTPQGASNILSFQIQSSPNSSNDGQLAVSSFSFGAKSGASLGAGIPFAFNDVVISLDKSSTSLGLLQQLLSGARIFSVTLTSRDDLQRAYATWTLSDVFVSQYNVSGDDVSAGAAQEQVHLVFDSMAFSYVPYNPVTGAPQTPVTASLNQNNGTATGTIQATSDSDLTHAPIPQQVLSFGLHEDIAITSALWSVANAHFQGTPGVSSYNDVEFTADTNVETAGILAGVVGTPHFAHVTYTLRDSQGNIISQLTLGDVFVDQYRVGGDDGSVHSTDTYDLIFHTITQTTYQNLPGLPAAQNAYGWDRAGNAPVSGFGSLFDFGGQSGTGSSAARPAGAITRGSISSVVAKGAPVRRTNNSTIISSSSFSTADGIVTINVIPLSATIVLSNLSQVYNGTPRLPGFSTTPGGLSVTLSYTLNGVAVASPTNAGSYVVTATISTPGYAGSTTGTLVITPADITAAAPFVRSGYRLDRATNQYVQTITVTNINQSTITGSLILALSGLPAGVTLGNATSTGTGGIPRIALAGTLVAGAKMVFTLRFNNPVNVAINYGVQLLLDGLPTLPA